MLQGVRRIGRTVLKESRLWCAHLGITHLSGPTRLSLDPTDVVVATLVKDGEAHVESFLRHHFALGVRHAFLLDNGSTDGTVTRARRFDRVTILRTALPYKKYQYALKSCLGSRFSGSGWCLIVDIDERFDFPLSNHMSVSGLARYLNRKGYTGVVAQMLDMLPEGPVRAWSEDGDALQRHCRWYDNTGLLQLPYMPRMGNRIATDEIRMHRGGIRRTAFEANVNLTKHPLLRRAGGARPSLDNSHDCCDARIADVSCVLYHYKFDRHFREKCVLAVRGGHYVGNSREYKMYLRHLEEQPDLVLKRQTARELLSMDQLVSEGFLVVSKSYREFVHDQRRDGAGDSRSSLASM